MGSFIAPVETAFNVTEVMQYARILEEDLDMADVRDEVDLNEIVRFWETLGNAVWIPRLMSTERQRRLESLFAATPLTLQRNPLMAREDSISAVTPGVTTDLRQRVAAEIDRLALTSNGRYGAFGSQKLWSEVEREGAVDFALRSVRPNFELRGCASCGKWYEPQLTNRGRFCSADCRKRFNNLKHSKKEDQKFFACAWDGKMHSMEEFSGLHSGPEEHPVSILRIGNYTPNRETMWCISCVEENEPLWVRYIAPLVEARGERASTFALAKSETSFNGGR